MKFKRRAIACGLWTVLSLALSNLVFAHGASVGTLRIEHPYAMPNPGGANQWIVYFRGIKNEGTTPDRLVNATTPIAAEVIFDKVLPPLGTDTVFALASIEVPAKSTTPMRHNLGGYRLLLKDLKHPIKDDAAGLLNGYKATSHWATHDVLAKLGTIPTKARVVVDRNRITGGGVTAGIDFGLTQAALLRSEDYAKAIQLYLEYDPVPPFNSGSPEKAPALVNEFLGNMFAGLGDTAFATARRAGKLI